MKRKSWKEGRVARIDFLKVNKQLWSRDKKEIVKAMKDADVVAPSTYWKDVHTEHLIELAKRKLN